MPTIQTPFGPIKALPDVAHYADGAVRSCIAASPCMLATPIGPLIAQFTANTLRKRQLPCIQMYPNAMIRTLPLEEQTLVSTPLGTLPAEQVTFYPDGAVKRVFPLNGALSGYWTQEDEAKLAPVLSLETPAGPVEARCLSVYFGPEGALRSLTLWPGERIDVPGPLGNVPVRIGVSFYDSGVIRSMEPAEPWPVSTILGAITAWDPDAIGVSGDVNSLRFREDGGLLGLKTTAHEFDVTMDNGRLRRIVPPLRRHPCDDARLEVGALNLEFEEDTVSFSSSDLSRLTISVAGVRVEAFRPALPQLLVRCQPGNGHW